MSDDPHHVGCIDGSTILVSRSPDGWTLRLETAEAQLSPAGAARLVKVLTQGPSEAPPATDPRPAVDDSGEVPADGRGQDDASQPPFFDLPPEQAPKVRRETVRDLLTAGLLSVGTILETSHKGEQHLAEITEAGEFDIDGRLFETPSAAAESVMPGKRNGWKEWRVLDGPRLRDLRWRYRVGTFPENAETLSEATVNQKRSVAGSWLEFALERDLNPARRHESAVESLLAGRELAEKTRGNYRTHLDQWFEQCARQNW